MKYLNYVLENTEIVDLNNVLLARSVNEMQQLINDYVNENLDLFIESDTEQTKQNIVNFSNYTTQLCLYEFLGFGGKGDNKKKKKQSLASRIFGKKKTDGEKKDKKKKDKKPTIGSRLLGGAASAIGFIGRTGLKSKAGKREAFRKSATTIAGAIGGTGVQALVDVGTKMGFKAKDAHDNVNKGVKKEHVKSEKALSKQENVHKRELDKMRDQRNKASGTKATKRANKRGGRR